MPKKSKKKGTVNKYDGVAIFRNSSAVYYDSDPRESHKRFMEMFHGKIDDEVISMVFTECFPDVDQILESLLNLSYEGNAQQPDENKVWSEVNSNEESAKVDFPTDSLSQSCFPEITTEVSESSQIPVIEDNVNLFENGKNEMSETVLPYDYYQTSSNVNFVEHDSAFSNNLLNPFQYQFLPAYNSQMYPNPHMEQYSQSFQDYCYNPVSQYNVSNYELKSYASQVKTSLNPPLSIHRAPFSSKATPSPKNGKFTFKWNNTDEVKNVIEKIKLGYHLLIILRGLPGSGKSTLARKLKFSGVILSTDDFFYKNGKYAFDPSKLDEAHYWNQNQAKDALLKNITPVIIDNTNTEAWEMAPYVTMGKKYKREIVILEPNTPWKFKPKELAVRNKHGVHKEKITRMLSRYQHNISLDNFDRASSTSAFEKSGNSNNSVSVTDKTENEKLCVSLEVVVHHEEQQSDILQEKDLNNLSRKISLPENFMSKDFLSPDNKIDTPNEYGETESANDSMNGDNCNLKIGNIEELKSLICEDSEDSQSLDKNDAQTSDQELTSWEDITEHDDDFLWKTSPSHKVLSFHCDTLLENEFKATNKAQIDLLEEKQAISLENSCNELSNISCLPAPDIISVGEPKSLPNSLNSFVDVLPKNEELISLESLNSQLAGIHIGSNVKNSDCISQQVCSQINSDEKLHSKINICETEKNHHNEKKGHLNRCIFKDTSKLSNFTVPSSHQLKKHKSNKSFDESYVVQKEKTKNEKGSETNLLRSKFFSVPILGILPYVSSENLNSDFIKGANASCNEKLFIETDIEVSKENSAPTYRTSAANSQIRNRDSLKSISCNEKLFIQNEVEISYESTHSSKILQINDFKNLSSGLGNENCFINKDSMTELNQNFTIDESSTGNEKQTMESENNHVPKLINAKPQRGQKITNMIFKKNITENKCTESISTNQENSASVVEFGEWECVAEPETRNENVLDNNKAAFTPKPPRNFSQTARAPDKLTTGKNDMKIIEMGECSESVKYKNKQRNLLFKQVDISTNWVFPKFVQNELPDSKMFDIKNSIAYSNSDTQTELTDYILINKIERNEVCSSEHRIIKPSKINNWNENVNNLKSSNEDSNLYFPKVATFEKSTSTEDLEQDIEVSEKLFHLKECFPHISEDDLDHLMGLCHNNESWVTDLLLDSEYNLCTKASDNSEYQNSAQNNNLALPSTSSQYYTKNVGFKFFSKSSDLCEKETLPTTEKVDSTCKNSSSESDSASDEFQIENIQTPSNILNNSNPLQTLQLSLDPVFAIQLEELFGSVVSDGCASTSPVVEIDLELARLIHNKWKNSVQNRGLSNNENVDSKSKEMGVMLSGKQNKKEQTKINAGRKSNGEPLTLAEIMAMEVAVELHKKEKLRKDRDIVTKKNRNKLYNMFPGADPTALDEIFESNNCCLETSVIALEEDLGSSRTSGYGNMTLKECEGYAEVLNESIDNWNKANKSDFENDDWVYNGGDDYQENNDKSIKESAMTITPEAEALRCKAEEHYILQQQCMQKSSKYYQRGMKPVASFYSQGASEHRRKFKEINKAASELILEQRNTSSGVFTLDLHGLYVREAIPMLVKFLRDKKLEAQQRPQGSCTKLTIITGQGSHSFKGPKLRPSVIEYLRSTGYFFSENYPGSLEVYLNSDGSSTSKYVRKDVGYDID